MNWLRTIFSFVLIGMGFIAATLAAVFLLGIGLIVFVISLVTGRGPRFQVFTAHPEEFQPRQMRDVTPHN
jgi:hypothetical protein